MMSRNQREGQYYGWVKGRHIRFDRKYRDKWAVSSWFAFRVYAVRDAEDRAQRIRAHNNSN